MFDRNPRTFISLVTSAALMLSAGCGGGTTPINTPPPYMPPSGAFTGVAFMGQVLAGSMPIAGATVQLYTAGVVGNGSSPTQLLSQSLTTDASGKFNASVAYTCANAGSLLFLVASGGHVGSNPSNSAITLMSSPGTCGNIVTGTSYTINEVTTVASAYAFAPFLSVSAQLGSSATNTIGINLAAGTLSRLTDLTSGAVNPVLGTEAAERIASVANVLHACLVSSGASSSACSDLFSAATVNSKAPINTLEAALAVVSNPGNGVARLFQLSTSANAIAFHPALSAAPSDWSLFSTYAGGGLSSPTSISIDSRGRVWVANFAGAAALFTNDGVPVFPTGLTGNNLQESFGAAVDANDNFWIANRETPRAINGGLGNITVFNSAGHAISGSAGFTSGGLNFPTSISFDTADVAWITDYGNSHITLLDSSGMPLSGSGGYTDASLQFPVALTTDSKRNGYVANQSSSNLVKLPADGSSFTPYTCCDGGSAVAIDSADNAWVANYYGDSIGLVSASGRVVSGGGFTGGGITHPQAIAVDGSGKVWVANYLGNSLSELDSASSAQPGQILSPAIGWGSDANLKQSFGLAIDPAGNIWVSNFASNTITEFIGMATPVKTPLIGPVRVP